MKRFCSDGEDMDGYYEVNGGDVLTDTSTDELRGTMDAKHETEDNMDDTIQRLPLPAILRLTTAPDLLQHSEIPLDPLILRIADLSELRLNAGVGIRSRSTWPPARLTTTAAAQRGPPDPLAAVSVRVG